DHVPVFVPEFEHPEDLVPAEDKALASLLPPGFLSPRIRPLSPRALARSEAYCRALEARVAVLETHVCRLEWQRQAADDFIVQHIMRTQDLEAGAHDDTLEDTGSSS
nr:hypothetical protein [Tanacetum cinerariifolium]